MNRIQYTVELDDLVAFHQFYMDTSPLLRKRRLRFVITFVLLFLLLGLLLWHEKDSLFPLFFSGTFAAVFSTWYWHSSRKVDPKQVAKLFEKEKNMGTLCPHILEIRPDGLLDQTAMGEQKTKFEGIVRIESTETHSFVFIGTLLAHVIPHAKVTEGDAGSFITTLKQKWEAPKSGADDRRETAPQPTP